MSTSGSIRALSLDGIGFDVIADADFSTIMSDYEKETIATSGAPIIKRTKRVREIEGVKVNLPTTLADTLTELADRLTPFPVSITEADGSVWRCEAEIALDARSSM